MRDSAAHGTTLTGAVAPCSRFISARSDRSASLRLASRGSAKPTLMALLLMKAGPTLGFLQETWRRSWLGSRHGNRLRRAFRGRWPRCRPEAGAPGVRAARKPSSVPRRGRPRRGDGHASSPAVARRVERPTRKLGQAALGRFPIWSCSMRGLPCPGHHCPGGALLPHLFTLTAPRRERRSVFCGTFLPVTRTGRYPAHCLLEFGLSSRSRRSRRPSERLEPPRILAARFSRDASSVERRVGFAAGC